MANLISCIKGSAAYVPSEDSRDVRFDNRFDYDRPMPNFFDFGGDAHGWGFGDFTNPYLHDSSSYACRHGAHPCKLCEIELCYIDTYPRTHQKCLHRRYMKDCVECQVEDCYNEQEYMDYRNSLYDIEEEVPDQWDEEFEIPFGNATNEPQPIFSYRKVVERLNCKRRKARRRNDTIRHHNRRERLAKIISWPQTKVWRATNGDDPWLVHSAALRERSVPDTRDKKNLLFELDQAGLELAAM